MEIKNLFSDDDDAVSPVIGVILMVAITVILAAVIGTFVLGLGDQVSNTSPTASFTFDYTNSTSGDSLDITHDGGDKIAGGSLSLSGADNDGNSGTTDPYSSGTDYSAGDTVTISEGAFGSGGGDELSDFTVRVVWESSNGGDTATLGKWTGPNA